VEVAAVVELDRRRHQAIPPDAQGQFAARMGADTVEVASNHVAMVSHPDEAIERILTAANAVAVTG
jgi:hypothetical protein